jgi:MFS family permease
MQAFKAAQYYWKTLRIPLRAALMVNFFVFGLLGNAVYFSVKYGLLIYLLDREKCQEFQHFQDIAFLATTFLSAPFIGVIGYRRAMRISLRLMTVLAIFAPLVSFFPNFLNYEWVSKFLFVVTGSCFSLVYVACYMLVSDVSPSKRFHASTIALNEGMYATGMLVSYLVFGIFVTKQISWYYGYWFAIPLIAAAFISLKKIEINDDLHEYDRSGYQKFAFNLNTLLANSLVGLFIVSLLLYVFIDKHFSQWILDFDKQIRDAASLSDLKYKNIEVSMLVTFGLASSRIFSGILMQRISPFFVFAVCTLGAMACMLLNLNSVDSFNVMGINVIKDTGVTILMLPLTAFFMGPILPIVISSVLSQAELRYQSPMIFIQMVLIFSGNILSTFLSDMIFENFSQKVSYSFTLIPISLIFVFFSLFYFDIRENKK